MITYLARRWAFRVTIALVALALALVAGEDGIRAAIEALT